MLGDDVDGGAADCDDDVDGIDDDEDVPGIGDNVEDNVMITMILLTMMMMMMTTAATTTMMMITTDSDGDEIEEGWGLLLLEQFQVRTEDKLKVLLVQ